MEDDRVIEMYIHRRKEYLMWRRIEFFEEALDVEEDGRWRRIEYLMWWRRMLFGGG